MLVKINKKWNMQKNILWMGFDFDNKLIEDIKKGLEKHRCEFSFWMPDRAIYDFDLVILNLPRYSDWNVKKLKERREEFNIFLKAGKILVCVLAKPREFKDVSGIPYHNYEWLPFGYELYNSLHIANGEVIIPDRSSEVGRLFKDLMSFKLMWEADILRPLSYYTWKKMETIAFNNAKLPVSFIITLKKEEGGGKVVFIPRLNESEKEKIKGFHIALVNKALQLFKYEKRGPISLTPTPDWLSEWKCYNEDQILKQKELIEKQLQEFHEVKRVLFEKGVNLVPSVALIFRKLGYNVSEKENLGREDIEISHNSWKGLVEVKSIESENKRIDKAHVSQALSHLLLYPENERENLKCIIVVSWDIAKPPFQRRKFKDIFTGSALELINAGKVCVLSSLQLWKIYNTILQNGSEELKNRIREKIASTSGIFSTEDS